jgi:hypothetical protein
MRLAVVEPYRATRYGAGGVHDPQRTALCATGEASSTPELGDHTVGVHQHGDDVGQARHASDGGVRELDAVVPDSILV